MTSRRFLKSSNQSKNLSSLIEDDPLFDQLNISLNSNFDKRSPEEKLEEINFILENNELDSLEQINLIIKKKCLIGLIYGDYSKEILNSYIELGKIYNKFHKYESALRNLNYADSISKNMDLELEEKLILTLELSSAYLNSKPNDKNDIKNHILQPEKLLLPFNNINISNQFLLFKKDFILGKSFSIRQKHLQAIDYFLKSINILNNINLDEYKPDIAIVYREIAETYEKLNNTIQSQEFYQKSYNIYLELGLNDSAQMILKKINKSKLTFL